MLLNNLNSFKYLKTIVSFESVLIDKGLIGHFRKHGDKLTGPCPIHGGDNKNAFVITLSKNIWYCFTGCGKGGDIVDFVRLLDKKTYRQTAAYLSCLTTTQTTARPPLLPDRISNYRPFRIQIPLDPYIPLLQKKGIHPQTAILFETGGYYGSGFLSGCVGVRIHDLNGNPIGYAGRRLDEKMADRYGKWKFPKGLPKNTIFYNFHRVRNRLAQGLVVTECPWGVMRLNQLHIPAVALLGLHLSQIQQRILINLPRVVLLLDGDPAGKKATESLTNSLQKYTQVRSITLPNGLDPDDLDDQTLHQIIKNGV